MQVSKKTPEIGKPRGRLAPQPYLRQIRSQKEGKRNAKENEIWFMYRIKKRQNEGDAVNNRALTSSPKLRSLLKSKVLGMK